MNDVLMAFLREAALVLASGVLVGGALYNQGSPLKFAITAGLVASATQVLKDLLPAGASVAVANARPTPVPVPAVPPKTGL